MCFLRFSKRKGVTDSDLYYFKDKGSIKSTSKLEALGRTLLSGAIGWILTKFAYFASISGPHVAPKENLFKKIYRSEFLQSSFIFVYFILIKISIIPPRISWRLFITVKRIKKCFIHYPNTLNLVTTSFWFMCLFFFFSNSLTFKSC